MVNSKNRIFIDYTYPTSRDINILRKRILLWYRNYGRSFPWRDEAEISPYQKIIAEFLLQRTKAETIGLYFPEFIKRFPNWESINEIDELGLQEYLKPIGLWQRREKILHSIAKEMVKRGGNFPQTRNEILGLPGVGQYIANAIMIFDKGEHYPLLDSNMARVLERYFHQRKLVDIRYDPFLQSISLAVVKDNNCAKINWGILDIAALFCKNKNMNCNECPISKGCHYQLINF